jgi:hypothetical protein
VIVWVEECEVDDFCPWVWRILGGGREAGVGGGVGVTGVAGGAGDEGFLGGRGGEEGGDCELGFTAGDEPAEANTDVGSEEEFLGFRFELGEEGG